MSTPAPCQFKVGDYVMFAKRCQTTSGGMPVQAVNTNMFDTRLKVDGQWWSPECFVSLEAWRDSVAQH